MKLHPIQTWVLGGRGVGGRRGWRFTPAMQFSKFVMVEVFMITVGTSSTSRKINVMVKFCVWGMVTTFRTPFFSKIGLLLFLNLPFYLVLKLEMRESKYFKNRLDVCMVKVYSDLLRCFMTSHTCNSTIVLQQKIKDDLVMLPWRCDH